MSAEVGLYEEESEEESGEGEGDGEGSSVTGSGSVSGSSGEDEDGESEGEEEEEDEPVLKYRRFAKEVVSSINQQQGMDIFIRCIAVHYKVSEATEGMPPTHCLPLGCALTGMLLYSSAILVP